MSDDNWIRRDMQRLADENRMLRREYARLKAQVAQLELERILEAERERTDTAWLQGKVRRQKAILNALQGRAEAKRIVLESDDQPE